MRKQIRRVDDRRRQGSDLQSFGASDIRPDELMPSQCLCNVQRMDLIMTTDVLRHHWACYLAAYGSVAADERERLLQQSVADDVVFTNPGGEGKTRAELISHIEDFQKKMPGAYFKTDKLLVHHGEMLAMWTMHKKDDDAPVATGYNFVRPDAEGRFRYMAGFF